MIVSPKTIALMSLAVSCASSSSAQFGAGGSRRMLLTTALEEEEMASWAGEAGIEEDEGV